MIRTADIEEALRASRFDLAELVTLRQFFLDGNYLLVALDVLVLGTSLLVMLEAGSVLAAGSKATPLPVNDPSAE